MEEITQYRQDLLSKFAGAVDELSGIVTKIPADAWHVATALNTHPPHYILARLVELDTSLFTDQVHRIYDENRPTLPVWDGDNWMAEHYDPEKPVQELLEKFSHARKQEVEWLHGLSPDGWSLTARHPWWGVRTLQWWVEKQLRVSGQRIKALAAFTGA